MSAAANSCQAAGPRMLTTKDTMRDRGKTPTSSTDPLLGPWSLTALAALLVGGGILLLLPDKHAPDASDGSALHRANVPAVPVRAPAAARSPDRSPPAASSNAAESEPEQSRGGRLEAREDS